MTVVRTLILLLLFPLTALGSPLQLRPQQIADGGVALLTWRDPSPRQLTVTFNGHSFSLANTTDGTQTLLGVPLGTPSGSLPVKVEVQDAAGRSQTYLETVKVVRTPHPVERLSLPPAMVAPQDPKIIARIQQDQARLKQLFATDTSPCWATFSAPVGDAVGSVFGLRRILNGQPRSPHGGVDFRSPAGRPVQATANGRVALADELYFTGNTVILDHGGQLFSIYAHLQQIDCRPGDEIRAGAILGTVGKTGRASGPHLHWGVRLRGDRIDPQALLKLFQKEEKP